MSKFFFYVTCLQMIFATMALAEKSHAQSLEEVHVSCHWQNSSLEYVFANIQQQTDFSFLYDYEAIKEISISQADGKINLAELLKYISSKTGLAFQIANDLILVKQDYTDKNVAPRDLVGDRIMIHLPGSYDQLLTSIADAGVIYEIALTEIEEDQIVRGRVTSTDGEPLIGATVVVKETGQGTVTDNSGNFTVVVPDEGAATLVVSYIGYQTREIAVNGQTQLDIQLAVASAELEEVVVIGYGTQSRANVTSAVSKLNAEDFNNFPITSFEQGIAGQLPGVQILQNTGAPGAASQINVRGIGTITAGIQPLIVIDGLPVAEGINLNAINPNDIESIEVLKDAAAAAIYGSRGSNGVILITTKKGQVGKPKLNLNVYGGLQNVANTIDVMDAYQRAELQALSLNNSWVEADPVNNSADDPNEVRPNNRRIPDFIMPYLEGQQGLPNTNWQDEIFRDAAIQNYELSVSGGSNNFRYFVSGNYFDQEGVVINSGFQRYGLRVNLEADISDRISFGLNVNPTFTSQSRISEGDHKDNGIIFNALIAHPAFDARDENGDPIIGELIGTARQFGFAPTANPVVLATYTDDVAEQFRLLGGAYLNVNLFDGLKFRTYLGGDISSNREDFFRPSFISSYGDPAPSSTQARSGTQRFTNWISENTLTYDKTFGGKHNVSALAGYTIQQESFESNFLFATNFPNDQVPTLNAGQVTNGNSFEEAWVLISYLGRVSYNFDGRYLLSASIRRDGSSRFGDNNQWGYFPSVSAGWRVSRESFFPKNDLITDLKIRASWGKTGNNQIPNFGSIALLQPANYILEGNLINGQAPSTSPNANLGWERTDMVDVGIDIGLFNNRLFVTADYYNARTEDLLLNVPVPSHSGFTSSLQNIGEVKNSGFELGLTYNGKIGALDWSSSVNFSTNENEVLALGPDQDRILEQDHITQVGAPIGSFHGYRVLGVFQNEAELESYPHLSRSAVGSYKYEDINGDGQITDADRAINGDFFPDYTFGFSSTLRYKGFDLGFLLQGAQGYEILNAMRWFHFNQEGWGNPSNAQVNNYFISPDNPDNGEFAKPRRSPTDKTYERSDLILEDGSFVRFRNITLGYTLPQSLTQKVAIDNARIYFSALNPFTFTDYSGYNPEVSSRNKSYNRNVTTPGVDYGAYPIARSFVFGLNLGF